LWNHGYRENLGKWEFLQIKQRSKKAESQLIMLKKYWVQWEEARKLLKKTREARQELNPSNKEGKNRLLDLDLKQSDDKEDLRSLMISCYESAEKNLFDIQKLRRDSRGLEYFREQREDETLTKNMVDNLERRLADYRKIIEKYEEIIKTNEIVSEFQEKVRQDISKGIAIIEEIKMGIVFIREKIGVLLKKIGE